MAASVTLFAVSRAGSGDSRCRARCLLRLGSLFPDLWVLSPSVNKMVQNLSFQVSSKILDIATQIGRAPEA